MLRWTIATAAVVILVAIGMSWEGYSCETQNQEPQSTTTAQPLPNPMLIVPGSPNSNANQEQRKSQASRTSALSNSYFCLVVTPTNLPNIYLVLIGVGGIAVAIGTLRLLESQTNATEKAAEAALKNAEAVVKSERPWILFKEIDGISLEPVETYQNRPTVVFINFRNYGRTVAQMTAWKFGLYITDSGNVPPPNVFDTSGINFKPNVIPQEGDLPHMAELEGSRIITEAEMSNIAERRSSDLWLCGIVRYRDFFDTQNEHLTKICRRYEVSGTKPLFILDGPAQYNDET